MTEPERSACPFQKRRLDQTHQCVQGACVAAGASTLTLLISTRARRGHPRGAREPPRGRLVLPVPLGAVLPRVHEARDHLRHVLTILCARVRDDAVVERNALLALVRKPHAERALRRHNGPTDAHNRDLQRVPVLADVAHERRVVSRDLCGGLHVPGTAEVEVPQTKALRSLSICSAHLNALICAPILSASANL